MTLFWQGYCWGVLSYFGLSALGTLVIVAAFKVAKRKMVEDE